MGIFSKLSTLIRSNINDLIARAENPEKMLNQIIVDMREQLTKAKQEVAVAIADERKLKAQAEEEGRQAQEWERRAMLAVREGRDDLARQALLRQQEYGQRAQSLYETWQRQAEETERLKASLKQLNDKIDEARRKKNLLVAKQKRAEAQKRIHETMAGLSDHSAFEAFDRMAERIEENERITLASAEVTQELSAGDSLEKEFKALESGDTADDRLLLLKQKMGLIPAGPEAAQGQLSNGDATKQIGAGPSEAGKAAAGKSEAPVRDADLVAEFEELERGESGA
ncbi:MAG TPA: PspA/IM30 family protein [Longimicrobiaceae bacterium]|nr:PspA/IM30 family protein [Longimicrobiaceae bacterium]